VRFGFLVNEVITGLRRNVTMTVAMILTTAISIGLFGGGLLVVRLADSSRAIYLDRVESQVFLTEDISANDLTCDGEACQAVRKAIESRDDVRSVRFLNREDAFNDAMAKLPAFRDVYKDNPEAGKAAFPASFIVKLDSPDQHGAFAEALQGQPGVRSVYNQKELVDRLFALLDGVRDAAFAIAFVQAVGAILLIANMVQVAAYTRRTEIGIMRLVGASRWYTQLPFLVEAMVAALIGVVLAVVGLVLARVMFLNDILEQFTRANLISTVDNLDILYIAPAMAFVGLAMAGVTAYVTLRIYVRR
jgi:cell division transport system permease protein